LKVSSSSRAFNGIQIQAVPAAVRVLQWRSLEVSAMAKREQQLVEIRQMTDDSIGQTVTDLKGELFVLRCKQATRQEYKSSDFRKIRKQVNF
jgi:large subunit ribosomal protein L29